MPSKKVDHIAEELEEQFHALQGKLAKAKDDYLKKHHREYIQAKKKVETARKKFNVAKDRTAKAAADAKKKGTLATQNQLKKAKAAMSLLADSLGEAKDIMLTAESNLKSAKPFEKKLAARARALAAFEREWAKKEKEAAQRKAKQAAERRKRAAAAKKAKATAKKTPKKKVSASQVKTQEGSEAT